MESKNTSFLQHYTHKKPPNKASWAIARMILDERRDDAHLRYASGNADARSKDA